MTTTSSTPQDHVSFCCYSTVIIAYLNISVNTVQRAVLIDVVIVDIANDLERSGGMVKTVLVFFLVSFVNEFATSDRGSNYDILSNIKNIKSHTIHSISNTPYFLVRPFFLLFFYHL